MKKVIRITQTFYTEAVIDIKKGETRLDVIHRIKEHCDDNGGCEAVICQGGNIDFVVIPEKLQKEKPDPENDQYEYIDWLPCLNYFHPKAVGIS